MLAYASCHSTRSSMSRNKPLIRLFCLEMSPSASNRLITVADSISTSSLLVDYQQRKLFPFPLVAEVSRVLLLTYPHTSTASTSLWCDLRNPLRPTLATTEIPSPCRENSLFR